MFSAGPDNLAPFSLRDTSLPINIKGVDCWLHKGDSGSGSVFRGVGVWREDLSLERAQPERVFLFRGSMNGVFRLWRWEDLLLCRLEAGSRRNTGLPGVQMCGKC